MNEHEAQKQLQNAETVPCLEGTLHDAREVLNACLAAGIPAEVESEACPKPGCTPKAQLMVRKEDATKVVELLRNRWQSALEREGMKPIAVTDTGEGEPPCPACGTAAPLLAGACSDCGLQLE